MTRFRDALKQYVALRRALGTQLEEPARTLGHFVDFLKREGAEIITSELALRWAMKPEHVQRATWARRLSMVRGFAAWLATVDPRTEVPAFGLMPARRRRPKPHIFTKQETARLMAAAAELTESKGPRAFTYVTLIGLLSATAYGLQRRSRWIERTWILKTVFFRFGKRSLESPVSFPFPSRHVRPLSCMQKSAMRSGHKVGAKHSLSRRVASDCLDLQCGARSSESHATSACERRLENGAVAMARDFRTFVTALRRDGSLNGTVVTSM
jgi:integrase